MITPIFELPDWAPKLIFVILTIGLVPARSEKHLSACRKRWIMAGNTRQRPEEVIPQYAVLADDPRMDDIKAQMLEVFNRDRAIVGLPPVNENYEVDL